MDYSYLVPNKMDLFRRLGGGSYNKLNLQIRGLMACSTKRAKAIEAATDGAVKAVWLLGLATPPAQDETPAAA